MVRVYRWAFEKDDLRYSTVSSRQLGQKSQLSGTLEKVSSVCDILVQQKIQQNQMKDMRYITKSTGIWVRKPQIMSNMTHMKRVSV
jgi:hypothetical protein